MGNIYAGRANRAQRHIFSGASETKENENAKQSHPYKYLWAMPNISRDMIRGKAFSTHAGTGPSFLVVSHILIPVYTGGPAPFFSLVLTQSQGGICTIIG